MPCIIMSPISKVKILTEEDLMFIWYNMLYKNIKYLNFKFYSFLIKIIDKIIIFLVSFYLIKLICTNLILI